MKMMSKKKRLIKKTGKREGTNMDVLRQRRMNRMMKLSLQLKMVKKMILIAMIKRKIEAIEIKEEVEVRKGAREKADEQRDVKERDASEENKNQYEDKILRVSE